MSESLDSSTGTSTDAKPQSVEGRSPQRRYNTKIVVAIIGTIGVIVAAYFARPPRQPDNQKFVLTGRVSSKADNSGIKGASLTFNVAGQGVLSNTSHDQGAFVFSELTSLKGALTVSSDGYETRTFDITPLYVNQVMDIQMTPAAGGSSTSAGTGATNKANPTIARQEANTGWWYETGQIGGKPDFAEAMKYYLKAVEDGDIIANWNIGRLYEHGFGVRQDMETARLWYKKAADQGDSRSKEYIENLGHNP